MSKKLTVYQKLGNVLSPHGSRTEGPTSNKYSISNDSLLKTKDKGEYESAKLQAQQSKYLKSQWGKVDGELYQNAIHYETTRIGSYADFESMEFYPEISAALDVMMEECLSGENIIRLLDGTEETIESLYEKNKTDFWVYAVGVDDNTMKPSKVDKVIMKGVKDIFKITLDDGSELLCTDNHKWLNYNNVWVETKDLKQGDSLKTINSRLDYKGYEKISLTNFNGGSKLTHIMVAENQLSHDKDTLLLDERSVNEKIVVHHKSFNKLNNDPTQLKYMLWDDHQKLHTDLNKSRWDDVAYANKMKSIFSENGKKVWEQCKDKKGKIKQLQDGLKNKLKGLTKKEKSKLLNRGGKHNGMYGVSRYGPNNPNYDNTKNHYDDIKEDEYINFILGSVGNIRKQLITEFNLNKSTVIKYNNYLCSKYEISRIEEFHYLNNEGFDISKMKNFISDQNNAKNKLNIYLKKYNISHSKFLAYVKTKGYKNWSDIISTIGNHRVIKVEYVGEEKVYDLVNSSVDSNFGVKCNEGMVISHNCTTPNDNGQILNVYSDSNRVKEILKDLFMNRMDIHTNLPMWTRNVCKYGDNFLHLNIEGDRGIVGVKQLPNFEIERKDGDLFGILNKHSSDDDDNKTRFIWKGKDMIFNSWQVAHFRLLGDDRRLPYGTSILEKARRIWKQLVLSEDAMLVYRVTRAPERRVYKVFVGNIEGDDVGPYVDSIANKFKRSPVTDPKTGQIDLRYNQLAIDQDIFIPVRDENASTPIDTLPGASNLSEIADIEYLQNKLFTALRVPKPFLGFEDTTGEGKNLALQDIRFSRTINRIQQSMIQELNKVAIVHLFLLGFEDDLDNFSLTLNNPSTQAEMLKIEFMQQKVSLYKDSVADSGNGFGTMSMTKGKRDILGWSDDEIKQDIIEQRMEKAAAAELDNTHNVIKHTGLFDTVDRLYGDMNVAKNGGVVDEEGEGDDGGPTGGSGGGFGGGSGGGNLDFDDNGLEDIEDETSDLDGNDLTDSPDMGDDVDDDISMDDLNDMDDVDDISTDESINKGKKNILSENKKSPRRLKRLSPTDTLIETFNREKVEKIVEKTKMYDKNLKMNSSVDNMINEIDKKIGK